MVGPEEGDNVASVDDDDVARCDWEGCGEEEEEGWG